MKKINKILAFALLLSAFGSCSKNEGEPATPAVLMETIEMSFEEDALDKLYVDATNATVLPMLIGESIQLGVTTTPAQSELSIPGVVWTTSDSSVITVNSDGIATAVGAGSAIVTVEPVAPYLNTNASFRVRVAAELVPATKIEIAEHTTMKDPDDVYPAFYVSESTQLTATIAPADATYQTVLWSSSDEEIATVDRRSGVVTGVSRGYVDIIATSLDPENPVSSSIRLYVDQIVDPIGIKFGDIESVHSFDDVSYTIPFSTYPEISTLSMIHWSSSDESVATVKGGVVTFVKYGSVTIKAECPASDEDAPEGYASSVQVQLNIPAGYYNDEFRGTTFWHLNPSHISNGGKEELMYNDLLDEYYWFYIPGRDGAAKYRGDIQHVNRPLYLNRAYPIITFRVDDVKENANGATQFTLRHITVDTSGKGTDNVDYKGGLNNTNEKWESKYICSDGSSILIYNLETQAFQTGGILPEGVTAEFATFQMKYADIQISSTDGVGNTEPKDAAYRYFWFKTFKSLDEMNAYIKEWSNETGITYTTSSIR